MLIGRTSILTGKYHELDVNITQEQLMRIESGVGLIQHIVPHLSADHREFLRSGITAEEWEEIDDEI